MKIRAIKLTEQQYRIEVNKYQLATIIHDLKSAYLDVLVPRLHNWYKHGDNSIIANGQIILTKDEIETMNRLWKERPKTA